MVLGDLDKYMQKNETKTQTYTIHQNKLNTNRRRNTIKVLEENIGRKILDMPCINIFTYTSLGQVI